MAWYHRLRNLTRFGRTSGDIDRELAFHIEQRVEDMIASGMSEAEARRAARHAFGDYNTRREETREVDVTLWIESIGREFASAVRSLRKAPGFAAAAVVTLTLTLGATTAAFTVVNGILLEPLPFEEPGRLVSILQETPSVMAPGETTVMDLFDSNMVGAVRDASRTLEGLAASAGTSANLDSDGPPEAVSFSMVTAGYFDVLGVRPVLGRTFDSGSFLPDGTKPAVISYAWWQGKWGGRADVLGEPLRLEGQPAMTVVGVLGPSFRMPVTAELPYSVFAPADPPRSGSTTGRPHLAVGRMAPGETIESVQAEMDTVAARLRETMQGERALRVVPLAERVVGADPKRTLMIFAGAVGMVLLIGILNLINLQATRVARRQRELSIRGALGASRWRLMRQMITEAMLLTLTGSALGFGAVYALRDVALSRVPDLLPRIADVPVDLRVFAFAFGLALVSGLAVGVVPVLRASRSDVDSALREGVPRVTTSRHQGRLRALVTLAETALAMVLLVGAGLLLESFVGLVGVDPGFDPNVVTAQIALPRPYSDETARQVVSRTLLEELDAVPGVERAALASQLPMGRGQSRTAVRREDGAFFSMVPSAVSSEFGRVMDIDLIAGRWISPEDDASRARVAVVSESLAREFWPGENAIGRLLPSGTSNNFPRVVGVLDGDLRWGMSTAPEPGFYVPYSAGLLSLPQTATVTLVMRSRPGMRVPIEDVVRRIEPDAVVSVSTMATLMGNNVERERFQTLVLGAFAALALALAMLGIYSVVAFATAERSREIGLRIALGAEPRDVIGRMMRQGLLPALAGFSIGLVFARILTRFLESYLYEIDPADSGIYATVALGGVLLVAFASWLPARRASRYDPMLVLRSE